MKKKTGTLQGKPIVIDEEGNGNLVTNKEIYAELSDNKVTLFKRDNNGSFKAINGGEEGIIEKAIENYPGEYYKFNFQHNVEIVNKVAKLIAKDEYGVDKNISLDNNCEMDENSKLIHNNYTILSNSISIDGINIPLLDMNICKSEFLYFNFDIYNNDEETSLYKSVSIQELISYCKRLGYNDTIQIISKEEFLNSISSHIK